MKIVPCPTCGQELSVGDELEGKKVRCASCRKTFRVFAQPRVQVMPRGSHSVWAWFVGLPAGMLILTVTAVIILVIVLILLAVFGFFGCCGLCCLGGAGGSH